MGGGVGVFGRAADVAPRWRCCGQHVVMPDDTVMGLRLRYKISMPELRKHNDFFGERFEVCDVLRIPVAGREEHVLKNRQVTACLMTFAGLLPCDVG